MVVAQVIKADDASRRYRRPMAIAAFAIACLGLLVAALSAGWQIAAWTMEGRRVKVRLFHGAGGRSGFAVGPVARDHKPLDMSSVRGEGFTGEEVVGIEVVNVGRQRVRVKGYSVKLVRGPMSFRPLGEAIGPELPHWLEPGEAETWYATRQSAEALIYATRGIDKSARGIRMAVLLGTGEEITTKAWLDLPGWTPTS
jgi:hypothetical protein